MQKKLDLSKFSRADYPYEYRSLSKVDQEGASKYCKSLIRRFADQAKNPDAAQQWIARSYMSVKYILAASLMLNSADFAIRQNLRIVEPYLLYYAVFNSARSVLLLVPEQVWNDGSILTDVTHSKAQNVVYDTLRHLSTDLARSFRSATGNAMTVREMFSYRFPSEGLKGELSSIALSLGDAVNVCQVLAEMAQLQSECLQTAFRSSPEVKLTRDSRDLQRFFVYEHKMLGLPIRDNEDWYRLWQFIRHSSRPWSLHLTARPGLVEDFFGAWEADDQQQNQFDPNTCDWNIIFDFV